jgi:hypothetical protein
MQRMNDIRELKVKKWRQKANNIGEWSPVIKDSKIVRFEVFTAVTMKNVVFWDVALCRSWVNRRFEGTYPSSGYTNQRAGQPKIHKPDIAGCFRLVAQSAATC